MYTWHNVYIHTIKHFYIVLLYKVNSLTQDTDAKKLKSPEIRRCWFITMSKTCNCINQIALGATVTQIQQQVNIFAALCVGLQGGSPARSHHCLRGHGMAKFENPWFKEYCVLSMISNLVLLTEHFVSYTYSLHKLLNRLYIYFYIYFTWTCFDCIKLLQLCIDYWDIYLKQQLGTALSPKKFSQGDNIVSHHFVPFYIILYCSIFYCILTCNITLLRNYVSYHTVVFPIILWCSGKCSIVLNQTVRIYLSFCILLECAVIYCIILCCILVHCFILYHII